MLGGCLLLALRSSSVKAGQSPRLLSLRHPEDRGQSMVPAQGRAPAAGSYPTVVLASCRLQGKGSGVTPGVQKGLG